MQTCNLKHNKLLRVKYFKMIAINLQIKTGRDEGPFTLVREHAGWKLFNSQPKSCKAITHSATHLTRQGK